jgi:ATP-dependent phosphoenolpyruvate carboxykinase
VPDDILLPEKTWGDEGEYWKRYDGLVARFVENFKLYASGCPDEVAAAGPVRLEQAD